MTLRTAAILITELVALALGAELTTDVDLKTLIEADVISVGAPALPVPLESTATQPTSLLHAPRVGADRSARRAMPGDCHRR